MSEKSYEAVASGALAASRAAIHVARGGLLSGINDLQILDMP